MKCMCAQTRPRFILSSEGVFGGMEFEPMLTPREKSPLPEKVPRGGSNPRRCGQRAQALPTELFRPQHSQYFLSQKLELNSSELSLLHLVCCLLSRHVFETTEGRNCSLVVFGLAVHSVAGSILLWGNFPVEGIFPLELTWVQTPFPPNSFV